MDYRGGFLKYKKVYSLLSSGIPACWMENPLFFSSSTCMNTSQCQRIVVQLLNPNVHKMSFFNSNLPCLKSQAIADNPNKSQVNYFCNVSLIAFVMSIIKKSILVYLAPEFRVRCCSFVLPISVIRLFRGLLLVVRI